MKKRIYLVTGAAGHLGFSIVEELVRQEKSVRAFILPHEKLPLEYKNVEIIRGDVRDTNTLKPFFEGLEDKEVIVIHCAGIVTIASKYQQMVYDVNVGGTKNIVDMCIKYKVKKLVHISSVHALPELEKDQVITEISSFDKDLVVGLYAKTKAEASQIVLDACKRGLDASIIHPSGIIGPGNYGHGHLTQMIIDYMNRRLTACVLGGYDFVDVRDVTACILACVDKGRKGECYICSNQYYSVLEILNMLHEITGQKPIKTILPTWFAKGVAPLAELYYKILRQPPLYTSYSLYTLNSNALFSHEKATKELDYHPRPMEETLKDTIEWLIANKRVKPIKQKKRN